MTQLTKDTAFNPKMGDGSRGVVQVVISGSETVTLQGSVDGSTYIDIETALDANTLKEVVLCPFMKFTCTGTGSTVHISETR